jgi:hypothetical protein
MKVAGLAGHAYLKIPDGMTIAPQLLLSCLILFLVGIAEAGANDPELYRRGYAEALPLKLAVADYNAARKLDPIAAQYPELREEEIGSALADEIGKTPAKNKQRKARLTYLAKWVAEGKLPKGTLLTFQYANQSRTVYTHDWRTLAEKFCIILWSGLDENPPGPGEFNDDAYAIGAVIRRSARIDSPFTGKSR